MAGLLDGIRDNSDAFLALAGGLLGGDTAAGFANFGKVSAQKQKDLLAAQTAKQTMEQQQLAIDKAKREAAQEQGLMGLQKQFFSAGTPGMAGTADVNSALPPEMQIGAMPPMPARQPQFDVKGYTGAAVNQGLMNPIEAIKLQQSMVKDAPINKLDVKDFTPASVAQFSKSGNYADLVRMDKLHFADTGGGVTGLNPFTAQPVGSVPKSGNPFESLILGDGAGGFKLNSPLIAAKQGIAKAGAARTDVRIENKMGDSLAAQVGPMAKDSKIQTEGAVKMFDAAQRIDKAIESGMVSAGPLTTQVQTVKQLVQKVGGGSDEGIRQTRQVIKSLAQMSVEARKQLQGQGQVTESEAAAVAKADSGDINDLTIGELKDLSTLTKRAAHYKAKSHQELLNQMKAGDATRGVEKFYPVQGMDTLLDYAPTLPQIGGGGDIRSRADAILRGGK